MKTGPASAGADHRHEWLEGQGVGSTSATIVNDHYHTHAFNEAYESTAVSGSGSPMHIHPLRGEDEA